NDLVAMANPRAGAIFGFADQRSMTGMMIQDLTTPEDVLRAAHDRRSVLKDGTSRAHEYTGCRRDGSLFPLELTLRPLAPFSQDQTLVAVARDLTEIKRLGVEQRLSERRKSTHHTAAVVLAGAASTADALANLLESICTSEDWAVAAYWRVNRTGDSLQCRTMWHATPDTASAFEEVTYRMVLTPGVDLPGRVWANEESSWLVDLSSDPEFARSLVGAKAGLRSAVCVPVKLHGKVHSVIELFSRDTRQMDQDFMQMLSTVGAQLAQFLERKETEKALEYQASHDALTDLPNRKLLLRRLDSSLRNARITDATVSLMLLDLDRFKEVNDTFGHHYGDLLLQETGRRLSSVIRDSDTVARLGGDEFAVLLPGTDIAGAKVVADAILNALVAPVTVSNQRLDMSTSIGIAGYPDHGQDADVLMQRADVAMYAAKRSRLGRAVYAAGLDEHSAGRLQLIAELREAIEVGALVLHYQPKVNFRTGRLESVEALVRWPHPRQGLIPPDQFIPLAEQTGLILPLTHWVLRAAVHQCREWRTQGVQLRVAINLSAESLAQPDLVDSIETVLARENISPEYLEIEITESAIMRDTAQSRETLHRLHDIGVRLAIDDFGTGYSSLAQLKQLPVDEIKIDKSFVSDLHGNNGDASIARAVIELGHNLGLQVVAEGIEDRGAWNLLTMMECDVGQGFLMGRPVSAGELTNWLRQQESQDLRLFEGADNRQAGA
ncbi:MAG: putative bifunctional diguanylate cyclase/phosphodiesterase, partial [Chloroflexota bacterium]